MSSMGSHYILTVISLKISRLRRNQIYQFYTFQNPRPPLNKTTPLIKSLENFRTRPNKNLKFLSALVSNAQSFYFWRRTCCIGHWFVTKLRISELKFTKKWMGRRKMNVVEKKQPKYYFAESLYNSIQDWQ